MIRRLIHQFLADENGPTAVEYAVILALIVAVCIGSVRIMSNAARSSFDNSAQAIQNAIK
jgi:pilus assembly protein Flp/PilA